MNHDTPTTPQHAWADDNTTQPVRPYTAHRWPTVIAAIATAIGALLIAAAPILDHPGAVPPTPTAPIEQTPAAQMILPGQQQPAIEPPHRAGVPYTATPGSLDPFDALSGRR
jgi:hypothetical protein